MPTASQEEIKRYRDGWEQRQNSREQKQEQRRKRALEIVSGLADLLQTEFNATNIYVFGSLTRENLPFHEHSDIDLGVSGIPHDRFYEAQGRCLEFAGDISVDLVDLENTDDSLKNEIVERGERIL